MIISGKKVNKKKDYLKVGSFEINSLFSLTIFVHWLYQVLDLVFDIHLIQVHVCRQAKRILYCVAKRPLFIILKDWHVLYVHKVLIHFIYWVP